MGHLGWGWDFLSRGIRHWWGTGVSFFLFYAQALLGGLYSAGVVFACLSWWGWGLGFCVRFSSFTRQTLMIINEKKKHKKQVNEGYRNKDMEEVYTQFF